MFEKRSSNGEGFDWTSWIRGEDSEGNAINDNTYFTCINILSNSVAKLPIVLKQTTNNGEIEANKHYLYDFLRLRPNANMNATECLKATIMKYKHKGIAGIYIDRPNGNKILGLYPVSINNIIVDDAGLINSNKQNKVLVDFTCIDKQGSCFDKDIIILRDNSFNGIDTKSTKNYISDTINSSLKSQKYQLDLFSNGLTNKAVVQLTSDIKDEKDLLRIQERFKRLYSNKGRIFTVPAGYNVTPLNLSLVDSQFAQLKIQSRKDISSAVGVPYNLIEKGSLTEEENISYLTNTITPIILMLEQELDWKLLTPGERKQGYKIRFNVNSMLRTSPEKQKNILCDYIKNGVYTTNDVRQILGLEKIEGADEILYPSGQITLKNLVEGKASWQKDNKKGGE
ncbi:phage portal protein [Clostridium botulinum]|nr:phage portal protein [Clostridium botulinum]NFJ40172.1 phage portal protein [Clostridium botulinum B str. Eklund 17B (NRP)]MBY7002302.1 phage portal protein [Clostridium botulinum]NFD68773.1 phage portal protein [Clostridium botulinum]NFF31518.1 phage portal protein [Clostridium botulinum]